MVGLARDTTAGGIRMKSIAQHIAEGIRTLGDLQEALQTAMQLEFSTIPPYLCAQWSIDVDPANFAGTLTNLVIQEMNHFALAGNMLTAIGGQPAVNNAAFIPRYPTHTLPGGIHLKHAVDLRPLSPAQVAVFMEIEKPEFRPVGVALAARPQTIGAFYDTIAAGFETVKPPIEANAPFITITEVNDFHTNISDPPGGRITSVADAQAAVARIKREGEGTGGDPDQPPDDVTDGEQFAHYYVFKQVYEGRALQKNAAGHWAFIGPEIQFPTVYGFTRSTTSPNPSRAFSQALTALLNAVETCWTPGGNQPPFAAMEQLKSLGTVLIQAGNAPEFVWSP
ncbi:MAG TPA: ferritin-like protein [Acetobacteraceae bacterium]|nr:ferritin-like protein [Acetobacteraceae bacterium]